MEQILRRQGMFFAAVGWSCVGLGAFGVEGMVVTRFPELIQ